jgi:hypothetical protein
MTDEDANWQTAYALFAYEMASALNVAFAAQGVTSKKAATSLISDCLNHLKQQHPILKEQLEHIAAKSTAQLQMVTIDIERRRGKP